jgi:hypothetical protein
MSVKQKIKAIHVINGCSFIVGEMRGFNEITEITGNSQEYPDHCEWYYQIFSNEKTLAEVINCPVMVEYEVD